MERNFILKLFITLLISSAFLIFILNYDVKATNVEESNLMIDEILEGEDTILCYDSKTNETTVVDMEELRQALKLQRNVTADTTTTSSYIPKGEAYIISESLFATPNREGYAAASLDASMEIVDNTFVYPHKQTCRLQFKNSRGVTCNGTGAIIGPNVLLTCSHCVYDQDNNNEKFLEWTAYPGYKGNQYVQGKSGWTRVYSSGTWAETHKAEYDWAICILESDLGNHIGWLGLQSYGQNSHLSNVEVKTLGYPGEVKYGFNLAANYQYQSRGNVKNVYDRYFTYSGLTVEGFSGGPILRTSDDFIAGVHHGLTKEGGDPIGVRITQQMVDLVNSLRGE